MWLNIKEEHEQKQFKGKLGDGETKMSTIKLIRSIVYSITYSSHYYMCFEHIRTIYAKSFCFLDYESLGFGICYS